MGHNTQSSDDFTFDHHGIQNRYHCHRTRRRSLGRKAIERCPHLLFCRPEVCSPGHPPGSGCSAVGLQPTPPRRQDPRLCRNQGDCLRARRLAGPEAPGVLQERHPCPHRLRLPGPRTGSQRSRQRTQRHCRCQERWRVLEAGARGRMGPRQDPLPHRGGSREGHHHHEPPLGRRQSQTWSQIKPYIKKGKTLYFSHGFSVVFKEDTKVEAPEDVDVILVAPKGSGRTVRTLFKEGRGINASVAVWQDVTGQAKEKAVALSMAVGCGYSYETTFEKEVYSDLYGERGVLMGGIQGMFRAQYEVLRANGHSPSEAFNETVEEATQSLFPLIGQYGMDYMYAACSTTARRGALDWQHKFYDANLPVSKELYASVKDGSETRRSLEFNGRPTYNADLAKELAEIDAQEIWQAGKTVRGLRPDSREKA